MVSIVIPTFNRHSSLKRAISSVLNQTYKNYEIIVVNDNKHDFEVEKIISNFNDKRCVTFMNNRIKGANGARNTGILKSNGSLIAFLDDDDVWASNYLENQISFLKKNSNYDAVFCGYKKTNYKKTSIEKTYRQESINIFNLIKNNFGIGASSTLIVKKNLFEKIGLWNEKLQRFQDLELLLRILRYNDLLHNPTILVEIPDGNQGFNMRKLFNSYSVFYRKALQSTIDLTLIETIHFHFFLIKKPLSLSIKYIIKKIKNDCRTR